ncbi:MAG TPA: HlyD family efflux transporter periplasmic adaptor subunit [Steroidobacteraceae bacterium]|jgi:HlyD family secretion protein
MAQAADTHSKRRRLPHVLIVAAVVIVILGGVWAFAGSATHKSDTVFTGYVVSQNVYMSSPVSGTLAAVSVRRGERVTAGQPLFRIDPTVRAAENERAQAVISASQSQVEQQQSALARARADLASAQAESDRTSAELKRLSAAQREKAGSVAALQLEQAQAAFDGARNKQNAARAQVQSASAGIDAARAQVRQAEADLTSSKRQLSDLAPVAPGEGRIEDIMFKPGETVAPNTPVVSIVPDGEVKVRFYVPQRVMSAFQPGRRVAITCDGCAAGMTATVDFVASRPEYTPPIIYSLDARQKLVFLVEALPSNPRALIPGQPMDVALADSAPPAR